MYSKGQGTFLMNEVNNYLKDKFSPQFAFSTDFFTVEQNPLFQDMIIQKFQQVYQLGQSYSSKGQVIPSDLI